MALFSSILFIAAACTTTPEEKVALEPPGEEPVLESPEPKLRRLTTAQYKRAIDDLFGPGLLFPTNLEPDVAMEGKVEIGASVTPISATGVVRYEAAAYLLLSQFIVDMDRVQSVLPCIPMSPTDADCTAEIVASFGRRAWRRPLTDSEVGVLSDLIVSVGADSGSFLVGMEIGFAAILQSPYFLYRSEYGGETGTLLPYEMASRLSFLLWNAPPDDVLLDAAESGSLSTKDGLAEQFDRMVSDDRMRDGVNEMFIDFFELNQLEELIKDPLVFSHAHPDFGRSARDEILHGLYNIVLRDDADFRTLLTAQLTTVDPRLAALYDIPASNLEGFGEVDLPESGGRRGLLGQAGILALHSHAASTSATLRGIFIRRKLLCQSIPPAPADVDASLPEADASLPTLRQRIEMHMEDPSCAGCHGFVDPIGLALENFDGIGRWRDSENDAPIDASGELDGVSFDNAWELGDVIAEHPGFGDCFAQHVYEYATGHSMDVSERDYGQWLSRSFSYDGWSFMKMIRTMVLSDSFAKVGSVQ